MKRIADSSLVYSTGSLGELLLTAIPKQLMKDPIFWFWNQTKNRSKSVTFFLELNHEKLTIWYQIVQCHFVHTAESLVPYLKLCSLLTWTSIFSTSYRLQLNGRFAANFKGIYIVIIKWQIQWEGGGGPVPLIRPDACLRLKFLHWQDRTYVAVVFVVF